MMEIDIKSGFWTMVLSSIVSYLSSFCVNFMGISVKLFALLMLVMVTDFITGLAAAKREEQKITARKGIRWVFKFGSYAIILTVFFMLHKELNKEGIAFLDIPFKLVHFFILFNIFYWELKSVDENFARLGMEFKVLKLIDNVFDYLRGLIKKKMK
jgi:phage-related holin